MLENTVSLFFTTELLQDSGKFASICQLIFLQSSPMKSRRLSGSLCTMRARRENPFSTQTLITRTALGGMHRKWQSEQSKCDVMFERAK